MVGQFQEDLHPRGGKGSSAGGRFVSKGGGGSAAIAEHPIDDAARALIAKFAIRTNVSDGIDNVSDEEVLSVKSYITDGAMNDLLRRGTLDPSKSFVAKKLDAMFARSSLDENTTLFRSYNSAANGLFDNLQPGDKINNVSYTSTSLSEEAAIFASKNNNVTNTGDTTVIKILAPKGQSIIDVDKIVGNDRSAKEQEILLPRDLNTEYIGEEDGIKVFKLDAVGATDTKGATDAATEKANKDLVDHLKMVAKIADDNNQKSVEAFVVANGQQYKVTPDSFSDEKDAAKLCYMNAGRIAMNDPSRTYVEGFIAYSGIPIQHAWTVDDKGNVFDSTLANTDKITGFFGVPFTKEYANKTALKTKMWGIISGTTNRSLWNEKSLVGIVKGAKDPASSTTPSSDLLAKNFDDQTTFAEVEAKISADDLAKMAKADAEMKAMKPTNVEFIMPDGTYTQERQQLHTEILDRMFTDAKIKAAMPKKGEAPVLILTGGRPAAGKTSALKNEIKSEPNSIYISADTIQEELPGYKGEHAGIYNGEGQDIALQAENIARKAGLNLTFDATMKSKQPAVDRVELYKAAGYKVHGYFVHTSPVTSALRSVKRFNDTGRYVPPIVSFKSRSNESTFDALIPKLDRWALYDNNGSKPVRIAGSKT